MHERLGPIDDLMLRSAVMSASMAMAVTDPHQRDNPIVFTNPAFSQLTGYQAGEIMGRNCRFLQGIDTDAAAVAAIGRALAEQTDIQIDILNYRKDGSRFVNRLYVSPVRDQTGALVHFFASQLDATDMIREDAIKRRREDVLRYLAGELSQRLGSTMEVVQTLVSSTLASASSILDASAAISARLVALGQVHRRISDNDWEAEDLESLAHQTIAPFRHHFTVVRIDGPKLQLGAFPSLKMASVIYELSSNATIRCSGEPRALHVGWRVADESGARRLRFEWREQGSTQLTHAERAKVHRALSVIVNDSRTEVSLRVDHEGGGLVCCIEAPLQDATSSRGELQARARHP